MHRDADLSIDAVVQRLEQWGRWARRHGVGRTPTIEGLIVDSGGVLISGSGAHVEPYHPAEMEIDGILAAMPEDVRREHDALVARYLHAHLPLEVLAAHYIRPRASVATLKTRIRVGHVWVLGQLKSRQRAPATC